MVGASFTISLVILVTPVILGGIGTWGFTKVLNRSVMEPFSTLTAPNSMMRFLVAEKPVVSRSNTTKDPCSDCPSEFNTVSNKSSTRYASHPYITLKSSLKFCAVWYASGNACTTPWSVMAMAGCPQSWALFTNCAQLVIPSMSLIWVWAWSSTLFNLHVSWRPLRNSAISFMA